MKSIKDLRIWLVGLAFLATVGILFGGQALNNKFKVVDPVKREISSLKTVKLLRIEEAEDGLRVNLKLSKINNLESVLDLVQERIQHYYKKPVIGFEIVSNPSRGLQEIRYDLSFFLEEAIASGHYIQLKEALASYENAKSRIYLTPEYIYIQLEQGDKYLYDAIPRINTSNTGKNGGGDSVI